MSVDDRLIGQEITVLFQPTPLIRNFDAKSQVIRAAPIHGRWATPAVANPASGGFRFSLPLIRPQRPTLRRWNRSPEILSRKETPMPESERDPRTDPRRGDAVRVNWDLRIVIGICGDQVQFARNAAMIRSGTCKISRWRKWCQSDGCVVRRAEDGK